MKRASFDKFIFSLTVLLFSCSHSKDVTKEFKQLHWIEISRPSVGSLYIDSVPLQTVINLAETPNANGKFKAYLIGFVDSVPVTDKETIINRNKYYQYDMQNNWESVAGENVSSAVFYQPRISINGLVNEGVIVFESNEGRHPDTLIYADSFGSWGKQKFILKEEQKK